MREPGRNRSILKTAVCAIELESNYPRDEFLDLECRSARSASIAFRINEALLIDAVTRSLLPLHSVSSIRSPAKCSAAPTKTNSFVSIGREGEHSFLHALDARIPVPVSSPNSALSGRSFRAIRAMV
jgi:hypothetical protein